MGRKSRERRFRRQNGITSPAIDRRARAEGLRLQQRGSELGPTLADFIAATAVDGHVWIRQRLLASHNLRMVALGRMPAEYLAVCWKPLGHMTFLYGGLLRAGMALDDLAEHPAQQGDWMRHLRWGLDSVQQSVRLLLAGQLTAAAVIARGQLERWTENRAHNLKTERQSDESSEAYVHRVWNLLPNSAFIPTTSVTETVDACGERVNPREVMRGLAGLIHAERYVEVIDWSNNAFSTPCVTATLAANAVSKALMLSVEQLTICVATLLREQNQHTDAEIVRTSSGVQVPPVALAAPSESLWPVTPLLIEGNGVGKVFALANKYDAVLNDRRPEGRLYNDAEMMLLSFTHFRARCIRHAANALSEEVKILGRRPTEAELSWTELPPEVVSEMAAALASWHPLETASHAAAAAVADALRSSYWLWLEDDQRSMAALRVVLEQTARLRVWRLKPRHAERLEQNGSPSR